MTRERHPVTTPVHGAGTVILCALASAIALSTAASEFTAQDAPAPGRQAVAMRTWSNTLPLGFTSQNRFLTYDMSRRVFESHDLGRTNAPVSGWDPPEDGNRIFGGTLSPDRRTLATLTQVGKQQSRIQLWNAESGEPTGPAFAPSDVAHLAFSPDGKLLAGLVALDGTVRVWDAVTGALRWSMSLPQPMQVAWIGLEFSPDGRFLAARNSYVLQLWDVTSRRVAGANEGHSYMAISSDWKLAHGFALGNKTQRPPRAALLDLSDPNAPVPAPGFPEDAGDDALCAFAADGRLLVLNTRRQVLSVWDTGSRRPIQDFKVSVGHVMRMAVSPDGRVLAALELDPAKRSALEQNLRLWDVATGHTLAAPSPLPGRFWDWQFDPDSRYLAITCAQGNDRFGAQIWRLPPSQPTAPTAPPTGKPAEAAADPGAGKNSPARETLSTAVASVAPRIVHRTYAADFKSWPVSRNQHGDTAIEAEGYAMRPRTNVWVGPGQRMEIPPFMGDFLVELRFRIVERKSSAALSLALDGSGATADGLDVFLNVCSDTKVTYTLQRKTIRDDFYVIREEAIADRALAPQLANHDWEKGGKITLHREGDTLRLYVNDVLLKTFSAPPFVVRKLGLSAAVESYIVVTSIEAGTS